MTDRDSASDVAGRAAALAVRLDFGLRSRWHWAASCACVTWPGSAATPRTWLRITCAACARPAWPGGAGERARLQRRARRLAWGGNAWHVVAISFFLLAAYIAVESIRTLAGSHHPDASWVGIGLALATAPTMPLLARAKRSVGHQLGSAATVSEGSQNLVCAYLSGTPGRPGRERARGLVVGRPARGTRDRRRRRARGNQRLERRRLRRRLLLTAVRPPSAVSRRCDCRARRVVRLVAVAEHAGPSRPARKAPSVPRLKLVDGWCGAGSRLRFGPGEWSAALVVAVDEGADGVDECFDVVEGSAADGLAGEDREEHRDQVEPGG